MRDYAAVMERRLDLTTPSHEIESAQSDPDQDQRGRLRRDDRNLAGADSARQGEPRGRAGRHVAHKNGDVSRTMRF